MAEREFAELKKDLEREREAKNEAREDLAAAKEKAFGLENLVRSANEQQRAAVAEAEQVKASCSALKNVEQRLREKLENLTEMANINETKIARLEETNKLLSETEKVKLEKALEINEELKTEWHELRQARELDLKTGREALQNNNDLTKKVLADLRFEKEARKEDKTKTERVLADLAKSKIDLTKAKQQISELENFKKNFEAADLNVVGSLAGSGIDEKTARKIKFECSVKKIVEYEHENADLRLQRDNFEEMYKTSDKILKEQTDSIDKLKKEKNAQIFQLEENCNKSEEKLAKALRSLQQSIIEAAKLKQENENLLIQIKTIETALERVRKSKIEIEQNINKKIVRLENDLVLAKKEKMAVIKDYENEVERHGKTVEKMRNSSSEKESLKIQITNLEIQNSELLKQNNSNKNASNAKFDEKVEENKYLKEALKENKKKADLILDELDRTNSLNRYLRSKDKNVVNSENSNAESSRDESKSLENYKKLLADARKEQSFLELRSGKSEKQLENLKRERDINKTLTESLKNELEKAISEKTRLKAFENNSEISEDLNLQISVLKDNNKSLREEIRLQSLQKRELDKRINKLEEAEIPNTKKIASLKEENSLLSMRLESREKMIKDWEKRCMRILEKSNAIDPEDHKRLQSELENNKKALLAAKRESAEIENQSKLLQKEIESLKKAENALKYNLTEARRSLENSKKDEDLKKECDRLREGHSALLRERLTLQRDLVKLKEEQKENEKVVTEMREKTDRVVFELEKFKMLAQKTDFLLDEEKETSNIHKRNAETAAKRLRSFKAIKQRENESTSNPSPNDAKKTLIRKPIPKTTLANLPINDSQKTVGNFAKTAEKRKFDRSNEDQFFGKKDIKIAEPNFNNLENKQNFLFSENKDFGKKDLGTGNMEERKADLAALSTTNNEKKESANIVIADQVENDEINLAPTINKMANEEKLTTTKNENFYEKDVKNIAKIDENDVENIFKFDTKPNNAFKTETKEMTEKAINPFTDNQKNPTELSFGGYEDFYKKTKNDRKTEDNSEKEIKFEAVPDIFDFSRGPFLGGSDKEKKGDATISPPALTEIEKQKLEKSKNDIVEIEPLKVVETTSDLKSSQSENSEIAFLERTNSGQEKRSEKIEIISEPEKIEADKKEGEGSMEVLEISDVENSSSE
ncbi:hypothetical protein MHBO_001220 [Bonamia ostreae]|uniref:Uncharacterized protein n=1 Tax=Bonamia ostreae TaxID=126728 RepID=A0ABV2AI76_9EUKA